MRGIDRRGVAHTCMAAAVLAVAGLAQAGGTPDPARLWIKAAITIAPDGQQVRQAPDGRSVPAGEAVALDSVVRLKTDLAGI